MYNVRFTRNEQESRTAQTRSFILHELAGCVNHLRKRESEKMDETNQSGAGEGTLLSRLRWERVVFLGGATAIGMLLARFGLLEKGGALVPRCPTHELTGLNCPACGGTRAMMRLLHGDLPGALHHNPLAVLAMPVILYFFLIRPDGTPRALRRGQVWALISLVVAFTVIRNLPWYPCTLLSPPR